MVDQLVVFAKSILAVLQNVSNGSMDEQDEIGRFIQAVEENWSDYFELVDDSEVAEDFWNTPPSESDFDDPEFDQDNLKDVANSDVALLLAAVDRTTSDISRSTGTEVR